MISARDISRDALRAASRGALAADSGAAPEDYWEQKVNSLVATVQPGGFSVTRRTDLVLGTLLGFCVAACICDPLARLGG